MSLRSKYRDMLAGLLPAGAVGAALLLGSTMPGRSSEEPARLQPRGFEPSAVADRLTAIRGAVSDVKAATAAASGKRDLRLAWGNWWRNWGLGWGRPWGWGWPNWNNWRNWNNWNNWWRNW